MSSSRYLSGKQSCDVGLFAPRAYADRKEAIMVKSLSVPTLAAFAAIALGQANAAEAPNFAGTYRCDDAKRCEASGQTFTVTQSGNTLEVKNDKGAVGQGTVTSPISISMGPPWNMLGVTHEAGAIEWSNGTQWKKQ
jgi:hypothetical protein